jgi:hypothetical protein
MAIVQPVDEQQRGVDEQLAHLGVKGLVVAEPAPVLLAEFDNPVCILGRLVKHALEHAEFLLAKLVKHLFSTSGVRRIISGISFCDSVELDYSCGYPLPSDAFASFVVFSVRECDLHIAAMQNS